MRGAQRSGPPKQLSDRRTSSRRADRSAGERNDSTGSLDTEGDSVETRQRTSRLPTRWPPRRGATATERRATHEKDGIAVYLETAQRRSTISTGAPEGGGRRGTVEPLRPAAREPAGGALRLATLGPPAVDLAGRPLAFRTRKA